MGLVHGREDEPVVLGSAGTTLLPLALTTVLEEDAGLFDFQLIRRGPKDLLLRSGLEGSEADAALKRGRDALAAMRPLAPDLPVVVASGYITEADLDELRNLGAQAILAKPFKVQELCERISEQIPR